MEFLKCSSINAEHFIVQQTICDILILEGNQTQVDNQIQKIYKLRKEHNKAVLERAFLDEQINMIHSSSTDNVR
jgi:hypothetical protein